MTPGCTSVFYHYVRDVERTSFPDIKALSVAVPLYAAAVGLSPAAIILIILLILLLTGNFNLNL